MHRFAWILLAATALSGCSSSSGDDDDDSSPSPSPTPAAAVTYHRDIAPVVERACTRCHNGVTTAPHDFTKLETVRSLAPLIASYVNQGIMPPAAADPSCRDYEGSEVRFVTDDEKSMFQAWADDGAPEGAPVDIQKPPPFDHVLHDADLELMIDEPYKPVFDGTGNAYTCFVVSADRPGPLFINGLGAIVDRPEIVHHIVLYLDNDGDISKKFGAKPFDCMTEHELPELEDVTTDWTMLAAWGPGGPTIEFDPGLGMQIPAQSNLILQMHYFESSPEASELEDRSGLALRTTDTVVQEVHYAALGPTDFVIPAGNEAFSATELLPLVSSEAFQFESIDLLAVFPHMHVLGQAYRNWVKLPGNEEQCIVESDRYDFHNQETYMFKEPVVLPSGSRLFMECTWNNSTSNPNLIHNPPIDVVYGEGTDDEMCFFLTYFLVNE